MHLSKPLLNQGVWTCIIDLIYDDVVLLLCRWLLVLPLRRTHFDIKKSNVNRIRETVMRELGIIPCLKFYLTIHQWWNRSGTGDSVLKDGSHMYRPEDFQMVYFTHQRWKVWWGCWIVLATERISQSRDAIPPFLLQPTVGMGCSKCLQVITSFYCFLRNTFGHKD